MGIVLGLLAAFGWGTADFIARGSTRRIGTMRTLFYMQFIGAVGLGAYLLISGEFGRVVAGVGAELWLLALFTALLGIASSTLLYRSFEVGIISIVSPIAASYGAITVVLALFTGETLTGTRAVGVVASLAGVILASISRHSENHEEAREGRWKMPPGIWQALAASVGYGVTFWLIGFYVTPTFGGIMPVWISRCLTIGVLLLAALTTRLDLRPPQKSAWLALIGIGLLDTVGFTSSTLGVLTEQVSIVTVLSSLFSAVTVVLAWIFLHERLDRTQWIGVIIIFCGIVLVSV
jgi:drug/metabolite transporter (DMT)-like permease